MSAPSSSSNVASDEKRMVSKTGSLVPGDGLEPPTPGSSGPRSTRLSYPGV